MATKKTSLASSTSASFDTSDSRLEIDVSIDVVTLDDQSCDEVFFDVYVTNQEPVTLGKTAGNIESKGQHNEDFEEFLSFNDSDEASFNKPGVVGNVEIEVIGAVREVITKKDKDTGKESKSFGGSANFIYDTDLQKIVTSPKVRVMGLIKITGKRIGKRYRWTGPDDSQHMIYALHEESGRSATAEVDIRDCEKDKDPSGSSKSDPNSTSLSLGVELADYVVCDGITIGGGKYSTYTTYGSFIVWPIPSFASLYALYFVSAEIADFDWDDLEISKESDGIKEFAELLSFNNSESASLQYAPLGNAVTFSVLGNFIGRHANGLSPSSIALKGPGEIVYRRTYKTSTVKDPVTGEETTATLPSDEAIKVGPTEVFCVDWTNSVILKGSGRVVAKYLCPARTYNFKLNAPYSSNFWSKWNCQVTVGYEQNDLVFGPLVGNGGFSVPNPYERVQAMWDAERARRFEVLKNTTYGKEFLMK